MYDAYALFPNLKKPQDINLTNIDLGYIFFCFQNSFFKL